MLFPILKNHRKNFAQPASGKLPLGMLAACLLALVSASPLFADGNVTYLTKVTAPDGAASDQFGYSVSQSGDVLAVGAYQSDPGGVSNAGAAYLYKLEQNGTATYLTKVTAPDGAQADQFGISVSQSGDFLAVGAYKS
ncbi:MAG: hypothetical protein HN727_09280, partial [Opitutae bacterium]|nr:hypothetical protein [Opitutae bacterium]